MRAVSWTAERMLPASPELRALAARLHTPELIVYPVRHHSPACAWQLQRLLAALPRPPSAILVEGPRRFTPLIEALTHPEARLPLAIYAWAVERPGAGGEPRRHAAYYPFCEHSPEWVALRAARTLGVPARFIDLDFGEQCLSERAAADDAPAVTTPAPARATTPDAVSLLDEHHYRRSATLRALGERLGCRDHEELWEHLFEVPATTRTPAEHLAALDTWCRLARLDSREEALRTDGTLAREAEMAWHIRSALAERSADAGPVLAVVGGFHAVVLPELVAGATARPQLDSRVFSEEDCALIRYDSERLDRLNGYAAGMPAPAWQLRLWQGLQQRARAGHGEIADLGAKVRDEAALLLLFEIAATLRERHKLHLPLPSLQAAHTQLRRLHRLRGRAAAAHTDLLDAVQSCFVQGEIDGAGAPVLAEARRACCGREAGRVPPGTARPPLLQDVLNRARRQRLKLDEDEPRRAVLDLYRRPEHRVSSRLLHGLMLLGVPFAQRTAGPDFVHGRGLERLQEHWEYRYSAATEAALVEASVYGPTLPLAVAARFNEQIERSREARETLDARSAVARLAQACVLGLHEQVPRLGGLLREAIHADTAFESLAAAAGHLGLLAAAREPLEARNLDDLPGLLQAAYSRALYLGQAPLALSDDGSGALQALARLRELLASEAGQALDASLFTALLAALHREHPQPLLRGAAAGLLHADGQLDADALAASLHGHLDGLLAPREAVAFLRGLLHSAREVAWQQPAVLETLDSLLGGWDMPTFLAALPELRLAFATMTPRETERIARAVAGRHEVADLGPLLQRGTSPEQVQRQLAASHSLATLLAADGLGAWLSD